jgi:hypothetical protein
MNATIKFNNRTKARLFARNWSYFSRKGYTISAARPDGSAEIRLFNITSSDKEWLDRTITTMNNVSQTLT